VSSPTRLSGRPPAPPSGRAFALCLLAFVTACGTSEPAPRAHPDHGVAVSVPGAVRHFRSTRDLPPVAAPRRLLIPGLDVRSPLEGLGQQPYGTVEVPHDWNRAGWYRRSPRPGEPGAAVILGHVDSPTGPAVFAGLARLRPGDPIVVERADGSVVRFRVTRLRRYAKARLPVEQVYWPTLRPELRLITCTGHYLRDAGGYQSNLVVFAVAVHA
jgi:hypothetical protein